jgi:glycosyltransferase involved in cell wall biosynthesis
MPVYNEASGIEDFLSDIVHEFKGLDLTIVIIDDCSSDKTLETINEFQRTVSNKIIYRRNSTNLGHGASTLRAISESLALEPEIIITVDGDGQFYGKDILRTYRALELNQEIKVVETVRIRTKDPYFRKTLSWVTRVVVHLKSSMSTRDANSPLRAYRRETLRELAQDLAERRVLVPNIWISTFIRRKSIPSISIEVAFISRRGAVKESVTWKQKYRFLPSTRLLKFSFKALWEVIWI